LLGISTVRLGGDLRASIASEIVGAIGKSKGMSKAEIKKAITPAGVVTLSNVTAHPSSAPNQALFSVTGEPSENYDISITAAPVTLTSGANTMNITTISSNPAAGVNAGLLNGAGTQTISVGGVLDIPALQPAGTYTNAAAITITINYN